MADLEMLQKTTLHYRMEILKIFEIDAHFASTSSTYSTLYQQAYFSHHYPSEADLKKTACCSSELM